MTGYHCSSMKMDLIEKLKLHLSKGITSEPDVVYFMVAIRKLMEQDDSSSHFGSLPFFCDWAVHSKMERAAARKMIKRFDDLYIARETQTAAEYDKTFEGFEQWASGANFKKDLGLFLTKYAFSSDLCSNHDLWRNFLNAYVDVITDCPLEFEIPFKKVRKVIVRRSDGQTSAATNLNLEVAFELRWHVEMLDGSEMSPVAYTFLK
jgi:hypothetical protein